MNPTSTKKRNTGGSETTRRSLNCLPEEVLILIISFLSLKDAVKTSILSKQWRSLWLLVPRWNLDLQDFPCSRRSKETYFELLVSQVLRFQPRPLGLDYMRIHHHGFRLDAELASTWMTNLCMHTIRRLEIDVAIPIDPPEEFFLSSSLEELKLRSKLTIFQVPQDAEMHQLKRASLEQVHFNGAISLQHFFGACPALKHMELKRCWILEPDSTDIIVSHHSLEELIIEDCFLFQSTVMLIMATKNLEKLVYRGGMFLWQSQSFVHLSSVQEATFQLGHQHPQYLYVRMSGEAKVFGTNLCTMLGGLSNVRTLDLNENCVEYLSLLPSMAPLPLFPNLETLRLCIWPNKGHTLAVPHFLDCARNLKHLRITVTEPWWLYGVVDEQRKDLPEPPDFSTWEFTHESLKEVRIYKCGVLQTPELLLVKFLLKCAVALEQFDVCTCCSEWDPGAGGVNVREVIESFPVASPHAEISFY